MMPIEKPRLSLAAARVFYKIVDYVRRYQPWNLKTLPHAASDVMDGMCRGYDPEVKELKRKHLIESVPIGDGTWTWHLTEHGCEAVCRVQFVPDYVI